jgi:hypothetical protein
MQRVQDWRGRHGDRYPQADWTDFPPARLRELAELPSPLGLIVQLP